MAKKRAKKSTKRKITKRTIKRRNPTLIGKWFIDIRPLNENFVIGQLEKTFSTTFKPSLSLSPSYSSSFYSLHDFWQYPDRSLFIVYGELEPLSPDNKRTHKTNITDFYGPFDSRTEAFDFLIRKIKLL